jgi:hypothetical protein
MMPLLRRLKEVWRRRLKRLLITCSSSGCSLSRGNINTIKTVVAGNPQHYLLPAATC